MVATALSIIDGIHAELTNNPQITNRRQINFDYFRVAEEEIANCEPFSSLGEKWILSPSGGGSIFPGVVPWITTQLLAGRAPSDLLSMATEQLSQNEMRVWEVSEVVGVTVDDVIDLGSGMELYPFEQLPTHDIDKYQRWIGARPFHLTNHCALVRKLVLSPVVVDRFNNIDEMEYHNQAAQKRNMERDDFFRALVLSVDGAAEIVSTFYLREEETIFPNAFGSYGKYFIGNIFTTEKIDAGIICEAIRLFRDFRERPFIERAIARLSTGRMTADPINKAIEFGMAMEIALMHDNTNDNQELRYRSSLRAAWLLGQNAKQRLDIFKVARAIYDARSKAVHGGVVDPNIFDAVRASKFVRKLLMQIVKRRKFPNWEILVMGGDDPIIDIA